MFEREFIKSSYSGNQDSACIEASAPEGYRFKKAIQLCGSAACTEITAPDSVTFVTSKFSAQGNCVEIGGEGRQVLLRDSKVDHGPVIGIAPESFNTFIDAVVDDALV